MNADSGQKQPLQVSLAGNPNVGKTSLFNRLTGLRHHVANYPGVTVERRIGQHNTTEGNIWDVTDLPGTYSLAAASPDERVVVESLMGHVPEVKKPDVIVTVADATNIARSFFLLTQLMELGCPVVLAINFADTARQLGFNIDIDGIARELGIPVVLISAAQGEGIKELCQAIERAAKFPPPVRVMEWPSYLSGAVDGFMRQVEAGSGKRLEKAEALRVLLDANSALRELCGVPSGQLEKWIAEAREKIFQAGFNPLSVEAVLRYDYIGKVTAGRVSHSGTQQETWSDKIDAVLTHRVGGLAIFLALMWMVFQAVYSWAGLMMDLIDAGTGWVGKNVGVLLEGSPATQSLVVDGIIAGVGGVIIFIPQILILFIFISVLESTGYMARAVFLMDKLFSWSGLNGKSFIPMLSSYACSIPGVMAARTIEDPRARLVTILIVPLMSCSARLPVYALMIGAFIEPAYGPFVAGAVLFGVQIFGLLVAGPVAWTLHNFILRIPSQPFLLEMPPYRPPVIGEVLRRAAGAGWEFLERAGTVILALSILVWALLYFPRSEDAKMTAENAFVAKAVQEQGLAKNEIMLALEKPESKLAVARNHAVEGALVRQSYLGRLGHWMEPVFAPAGFDWRITIAVLASFPAREIVISSLGILFQIGNDVDEDSATLREAMAGARWDSGYRAGQLLFTVPTALSMMVFFALCMQCAATLAIMAQETSWRWAAIGFIYMTVLAWVGAVATYHFAGWLL